MQHKNRLDQLQLELREAMNRAAEGRMALTAQCAAAVHCLVPMPSPEQIREADIRGAHAEAKWRELDDHLNSLRASRGDTVARHETRGGCG